MTQPAASDDAVLAALGAAAARTRIARNLSQQDLADRAGIGKRTLERFERGESTTTTNLVRILRALDLLDELEQVFPATRPSPLDELRATRMTRRRASPRPKPHLPAEPGPETAATDGATPAAAPLPPRARRARNQANRPRWGDEQSSP